MKYIIMKGNEEINSNGGIALVGSLLDRLGVCFRVRQEGPRTKSATDAGGASTRRRRLSAGKTGTVH